MEEDDSSPEHLASLRALVRTMLLNRYSFPAEPLDDWLQTFQGESPLGDLIYMVASGASLSQIRRSFPDLPHGTPLEEEHQGGNS